MITMGSFDYTCTASGLPIEASTPVRFLLLTPAPYEDERPIGIHGSFFPRTVPLKATYNDYGSVDEMEDGPAREVWLEALHVDMVEKGTGDNTVHDVPTRKTMKWDKLLRALQEGRVWVRREVGTSSEFDEFKKRNDAPVGVPTLQSVEKLLVDAKYAIEQGKEGGYLVDEIGSGEVRVRWGGLGDHTLALYKIMPLLNLYASMLSAGSGSYSHGAEILLRAKPDTKGWRGSQRKQKEKPLRLWQAMIREDVWQALCQLQIKSWDGSKVMGVDYFKARLQKEVDNAIAHHKSKQKLRESMERLATTAKTTKDLELQLLVKEAVYQSEGAQNGSLIRDPIPYTIGPGFHANLLAKKGAVPDSFVQAWAELCHVEHVLNAITRPWRPEVSGHQGGEWEIQQQVHSAIGGLIAGELADVIAREEESAKQDAIWEAQETARKAKAALKKASAVPRTTKTATPKKAFIKMAVKKGVKQNESL